MTFEQLIQLVVEVNSKYNEIIANGKTIDGFDEQTVLVPTSFLHVSNDGISEKLAIQTIINSILQVSIDQLLSIGEITIDGNDITIPAGCQWQISGVTYFTVDDTVINIPFSEADNTRIDIIVATVSGTLVKYTGTETTGIAVRPNIPLHTVLVTQINVTEDSFGPAVFPLSNVIPFGSYLIFKAEGNGFGEALIDGDEIQGIWSGDDYSDADWTVNVGNLVRAKFNGGTITDLSNYTIREVF